MPLRQTFVSTFSTGTSTDSAAPTVVTTTPADAATGVATNTAIAVTFSEPMLPSSLNDATFSVTSGTTTLPGVVAYTDAARTATFVSDQSLAASTTFNVLVTAGAEDVAGNPLAAAFPFTFTTGAGADTVAPTVSSTTPADLDDDVFIHTEVDAVFSEPMNPTTISNNTFRVFGPGGQAVAGTVAYDAVSRTATFKPLSSLTGDTDFTAVVATTTRDLAGNGLAAEERWVFTTGLGAKQQPIDLRSAAAYAILAGSTITNSGPTEVTGDMGLDPGSAVDGFPPGTVIGDIHISNSLSSTAKGDLTTAYNDAQGRSLGGISRTGNLGGLTLTPGLYISPQSMSISGTGPQGILTLDALGDENAVFIFRMADTLFTDPGTSIVLQGDAQAANIFWAVGSSATLDTTTAFFGTIMADQSISLATGASLTGRALARIGAVTLEDNAVIVPAP